MPEGRLTWYDDNVGTGRIEASSGRYLVRSDDMEPDARAEGAMVAFDIERERDGTDHAVNVTLRRGTRSDPDQGRFGENRS
jgi:cold shock CspA family protein